MYMMPVFDNNNNNNHNNNSSSGQSRFYYRQFSESLLNLFLATAKAPFNSKSQCRTFPLSNKNN
jgi:hypothetical protein